MRAAVSKLTTRLTRPTDSLMHPRAREDDAQDDFLSYEKIIKK